MYSQEILKLKQNIIKINLYIFNIEYIDDLFDKL